MWATDKKVWRPCYRGLIQGGSVSERRPTCHCRVPTSQHSEKNLRNDGESGCGLLYQIFENRKILQKRKKNNLLKTKRTLQSKFKLSGSSVFTSSLSGGAIRPSGPPSVMPLLTGVPRGGGKRAFAPLGN